VSAPGSTLRYPRAMKITVLSNGPLLISGAPEVVDASGKPFDLGGKPTVALCRCGGSQNKPFCDGAHRASFRAQDSAPRR